MLCRLQLLLAASVQPYGEDVAGRGVQDRVLGEIEQDRQPVALAAAEHDQVDPEPLRRADDLRLDATGLDELTRVAQRQLRSEEHTSELQSQSNLVCRLLL